VSISTANDESIQAACLVCIELEVIPMPDTSNRNEDQKECTASCDSEFVDCVESWRQDCLIKFRNCASSAYVFYEK